jgi:hypothetical protein
LPEKYALANLERCIGNVQEIPYRLVIVLYARKKTQTLYHRSPYLAMTFSLLLTQFLYQRKIVAE